MAKITVEKDAFDLLKIVTLERLSIEDGENILKAANRELKVSCMCLEDYLNYKFYSVKIV